MEVVGYPDIVNGDDVVMGQRGDNSPFTQKPLGELRVIGEQGIQNLESDPALQRLLQRQIHYRHSPLPELTLDFVAWNSHHSAPTCSSPISVLTPICGTFPNRRLLISRHFVTYCTKVAMNGIKRETGGRAKCDPLASNRGRQKFARLRL